MTWRVTATGITIGLCYLITGRVDVAVKIGAAEFFAKLAGFYIHERLWEKRR